MPREAIVLAGGLGTRLREVLKDIPKPMAEINGRPFLEYLLRYLSFQGVERVILSVGYRHEVIESYFGDRFLNLEIIYSLERTPMGTGGAVKLALRKAISDTPFILNGDTLFLINLDELLQLHKSKGSVLTMALREVEDVSRYGSVEVDEDLRIKGFTEKNQRRGRGLINGGIYILDKDFFSELDLPDRFSFERDFISRYFKLYPFYGLPFKEYFIDIGVPEDYERAKRELVNLLSLNL